MKLKNLLIEAETFTAINKKTGKTSVFKSKDTRDAAVKAGTHAKTKKDGSKAEKPAKSKVNIFAEPKKGKETKSKEQPKKHTQISADSAETRTIQTYSNARPQAIADFVNKHKLDASALGNFLQKGSLSDRMDFITAMVGTPGNKYEKKIIDKFSEKGEQPKAEPKSKAKTDNSDMGVDKVVYNTRTKTVGIVRMADERGETKTDADGNVNTSELEPYNPMKYPHQKDAKVAPSTSKEIDSRGLWKPFAQDKDASKEEPKKDEPKAEPKKKRAGNPQVNKTAKKKAEEFGITPQKLGKDEYVKSMYKAAVEALTDSNYHSEARELVAAIEGKPEWAKKPEYPSMDDPKYAEKMKDIRTKGVDSSEYWDYDKATGDFASSVSQESGWSGVDAADGIAFTLRMNGFHKEADKIQSIFDNKPYMKNESISLKKMINK